MFDQVSACCAGFTKFIFIDNNNTSNNNTNMAVELLGVSNLPVPHVIFFLGGCILLYNHEIHLDFLGINDT